MQYLGVDISKEKFDVALIQDAQNPEKVKQKVFANSPAGFTRLMSWLESRATEPVHVAMEATGAYWEALAVFLCEKGLTVSVVNPGLIKKEAESWGVRNKTDSVDARVIARFCLAKRPRAWVAPRADVRELRDLVRHLDCLEQEKRQNENRLGAGVTSDAVKHSLEEVLAFLDAEIKRLEDHIADHIDRHPGLKTESKLLESIPGIGKKTAAVVLGELGDISNFSRAKQVAAYAGLSPRRIASGKLKGQTRMCKAGNSRLRRALYFPAIVAASSNPVIRGFYERLRRDGKCKMSAIGACMRKLIQIVYGVLKTGTAFEVPA
jgi:transposase